MDRKRMFIVCRMLFAGVVLFVLSGCSAGGGLTPTGRRLVGDMSAINMRVMKASGEDAALERELVGALLNVRESAVKLRVLSDLDELLSPAGGYEEGRLQAELGDGESDNALVGEVRTGRMALPEAREVLRDHAAGVHLSDGMRQRIEGETVARFAEMEQLKRERDEIMQVFADRDRALARMGREMNAITGTLMISTMGDGVNGVTREALLRRQLNEVTGLVGDERVRELLRAVIDTAYPGEVKMVEEGIGGGR